MKEFTQARFKLFSWYMLINIVLLATFTIVAFQAERQSFAQIDQLLQNRIQRPIVSNILEQRLSDFSGNFRKRLLYFDLILFLVSAAASWLLSGITLKPIETMLHKQQEFSADASHELRTPITTIIMELEALKRTNPKLSSRVTTSLQVIQDESMRMKRLVTNLLTLVRSNHDTQGNSVRFELTDLTENVMAAMRRQASSKGLTLVLEKGPSAWILGDQESVREAISILIDNAIKFTPCGSITVTTSKKNNAAYVSVKDSGVGIDERDIPSIFDRFYRIRSRSNAQGSGLGLSIAKKIMTEHGGEISVESKVDVGSTFTLSLPIVS